ncbi:surfactin synthetase subunit 3 [Thozetella sp. PMI_491]|nr:surfactin synthetase subunit 3 [Thozetella sp. PMI_491]
MWAWNSVVPPNIEQCMHDLISQRAVELPNAPAVSAWDGDFTNGELEDLSTRLAHRLRSLGAGVGSRVPLCFEKSRWTVVAVLAVMKAGAAFVLMDPSQPEARLSTIVEQTEARIILSSAKQEELARRIAPTAVVVPTHAGIEGPEWLPGAEPLPPVPPSAPMYIIFTSGSTGKPKGIVISHENYTSGALPRADAVGYAADLRVFEFASYAFDVCIDCILCTLVKGGCVCTPADEARMNDLSGAIRASNAKMAHMTPSVARVLDSDILPSLEVLGLGGEAVSASDAIAWNSQTKVVIAYGPSECTVGCTINNDVAGSKGYATIGKGVGGLTWIVDPADHNRLVPVGAVGELLIEGPVLGLGYLNEPEKTAEAFIDPPPWLLAGHRDVPGRDGKLYKTGDLVRYDRDGSGEIVFVGRKDQQVKLRGQRVELAEIEHHLRKKLPSSAKLAAEVISPGGTEPTLVVFLAEPESNGLRLSDGAPIFSPAVSQALAEMDEYLGAELPRYMVPTAYIPLPDIPSLVSGKTDRKKLREMGRAMTREQIAKLRIVADPTKPETDEEHALYRAWTHVLGNDLGISVGDSFFALGGDSLKAMKLVAAARSEGLLLSVATVFTYPTLREMAAVAGKHNTQDAKKGVPAFSLLEDGWSEKEARAETALLCGVGEVTIEDVYPCTPLQEALAALSAKFRDAYVAQRVMELPDESTAEKLRAAFDKAALDCAILRTRIVQVPGRGLIQVVVKEAPVWRTGTSVQEYLEIDRAEEMDLGSAMVRYALITEGGKIHFVWTVHHSIYDGWSMPLVVERINRAYQGLPTERPAEFKEFIQYLQSMDREACKTFWREQLDGATGPQFPPLPREGYQAKSDSLLEVFIPMKGRPASDTTAAAVIRGGWALTASNYAGSNDMVFGETLTGRNVPVSGVDEIEGPMITTVPVRVRINRAASVAEFLSAVHGQVVAQMPYEHMGLQHIRRLSPDALQACELRAGLVLNPAVTEEVQSSPDLPANGLVPAGDAEAAQEALNFNTYSLMLVCSLGPDGVLVMASFDSNMVDKIVMERVLEQFSLLAVQLHEEKDRRIGELEYITQQDRDEVWQLSSTAKASHIDPSFDGAEAFWVVDPLDSERLLPRGAVGELLIETTQELSLPALKSPQWWLSRATVATPERKGRLFKTDKLVKITADGSVVLDERVMPVDIEPVQTTAKSGPTTVTSEKQRKLRSLWSRVLSLDEETIGLSDNFFRLGGDSISAMKLTSEARAQALKITVADIFANRSLFAMANVSVEIATRETARKVVQPFQSLDVPDVEAFLAASIRPVLSDAQKVVDVLPTRPLQEIAVKATVNIPRYSMRYEFFHFETAVNANRLRTACQALITANEVLRTVYLEVDGTYYGVVLEELVAPFVEYDIDGDAEAFARTICTVDVQERVLPGSSFVRWFLVHGKGGKSSLVFRVSHAQYDELCLPIMLRQLSALYEGRPVPTSAPFSGFVNHVIRDAIPRSVGYWTDLLRGSSLSVLKPDIPVTARRHFAISQAVDMSARSRDITIATLPTAAWALTLSRRLGVRDVVFGEVASGRNTDLPGCDAVVGPCWQYIPVRVQIAEGMTGLELLQAVQNQHHSSAGFEGMALTEIVRNCTDWPADIDWFDSVVHQDVEHVEELPFLETSCRMETLYVHEEPLREWKIQAYPQGDTITLEIVTFESWGEYAKELLAELVQTLEALIQRPGDAIYEGDQ